MVRTKMERFIILLLCLHTLLPATTAANTNNSRPTGFSMELVHREFSKRSPYYSANLTDSERYERLVQLSKARLQWLKYSSSEEEINLTAMRPRLIQTTSHYLVAMRVGTGPGMQEYLLDFDTGSDLTWIQCEPCKSCYNQLAPKFQPTKSPTYKLIPCSDPVCRQSDYKCVDGICTSKITYDDKSKVYSDLSRETFSFTTNSGDGSFVSVQDLVFGCSHSNKVNFVEKQAAGLIGMNGDPESFAVQLAGVTGGVFSYCLRPLGPEGHTGYVRFGTDIPRTGPLQTTPLEIPPGHGDYHVTLLDVSLENQRLNIDPRIFKRTNSKNGVIFDNGAAVSFMVAPAFRVARDALQAYFKKHNVPQLSFLKPTCFRKVADIELLLPSMTFHFDGANMEVPGIQMFRENSDKKAYCWTLSKDDDMTLIGAAQQANHRLIFDLGRKVMSLAPEDCYDDVNNVIN